MVSINSYLLAINTQSGTHFSTETWLKRANILIIQDLYGECLLCEVRELFSYFISQSVTKGKQILFWCLFFFPQLAQSGQTSVRHDVNLVNFLLILQQPPQTLTEQGIAFIFIEYVF